MFGIAFTIAATAFAMIGGSNWLYTLTYAPTAIICYTLSYCNFIGMG